MRGHLNMWRYLKNNIIKLNQWIGTAVSWLMLVLVLELVYDALARYIFNAPTVWSFDVSYMLYATLFMLGGGYTLYFKGHIRVDLIYEKVSKRGKAIIDLIGYIAFFFPVMVVLIVYGAINAHESWLYTERAQVSYWAPTLWWFKLQIPIGGLLLLLQGIVEFVKVISDLTATPQSESE
jgi:TRAP-type mannitol/chloroaromatic compound transport system permease small subunit